MHKCNLGIGQVKVSIKSLGFSRYQKEIYSHVFFYADSGGGLVGIVIDEPGECTDDEDDCVCDCYVRVECNYVINMCVRVS